LRPVFDEAGQLIGPEIHCGPDDVHAVGAAFGEGFGAHVCVFDEQEFDRLLMPVPEDAILVRLEAVVSDESASVTGPRHHADAQGAAQQTAVTAGTERPTTAQTHN